MRKLSTSVLVTVLVLSACGGGEDTIDDQPATTEAHDPAGEDDGSEDTSPPTTTSNEPSDANSGESSDEPIPEGSGPLPPDSIRIGDEIFERMEGASLSDCFVQDGAPPFSVNGALNDDDRFRFSVDYLEDGVYDVAVSNEEIFWVAGPLREGTEVDVEWDVDAQTISGTGLFNDAFLGLWAYGSFQFTCSDS
jgi:hypothetical protein